MAFPVQGIARKVGMRVLWNEVRHRRMRIPNHAYLVGVKTTAKMPNGSLAIRCKIGKAKAIVFPLPVLAPPMQSRPDNGYDLASLT